MANRNALIAKIHAAAKARGLEDEDRRAFMKVCVGKISCKEMTDGELSRVAEALSDHPSRGGAGPGGDRPTDAQFRKLAALARKKGWDGLKDHRLQAFVERTAGVESTRFLTRAEITAVITGLTKWTGEAP